MIKGLIKKYFKYFTYFFRHLHYRVFIAFFLAALVGLLDGFGLTMILPLLQMIDGSNQVDPAALGNMRFVIDFITSIGITLTLESVLLAMLVFFFFKGVARFIDLYYRVRLRYFFVKKLRFENVDKLKDLSFKRFVLSDSGKIQNTLSGEVGRIIMSFANYFNAIQNAMLVLVYFALAALANAQLAIIVAVGGALVNLLYRSFFKKSKGHSKDITTSGHGYQGLLIQMVAFFKYLKASAGMNKFAEKLKQKAEDIERSNKKIGFINSLMESSREPLIMLLVTGIIFLQILVFGQGLGSIILSLALLYRALNSLMFLQVQWNAFMSGSASIDNMSEFMGELSQNQERYGSEALGDFNRKIEVRDVSFAYTTEKVLSHINLEIVKNETVAFVGESGSGKTTLVNLLSGLMKPDTGEIRVDDQNLFKTDVRDYQSKIGYITQEPVIFSDTIFNNITFWSDKTPENLERFWAALKRASIDDFVMGLDLAEDSPLGTNGIMVSGGQKQRLSIARELFKDVEILILDEATSALDTQTEKTIQDNIESLKGNYTFLIVAHRLSTIKNADKIVLMKEGTIQGIGSFDNLILESPEFKSMVELQEI